MPRCSPRSSRVSESARAQNETLAASADRHAPLLYNRGPLPMPMEIDPSPAHSIALVIEDADAFPEMKRGLQPLFRARLANNENAIKDAVEDANLQAMLLDLDSIGDGAGDGLEVLQEIRAIRADLVLVAMTRSREHTIPLRASQAGADEFVHAPVNFEQLQGLVARAIEKRALEFEGRGIAEQAEQRGALFFMLGARG